MSAVVSILLGTAARIGVPILKDILQKQIGGTAGEIGGVVIDSIAQRVGVPVDKLSEADPSAIEDAMRATEADLPQILVQQLEIQRESNKLMLAEMQKETAFGWLWRPAGMWLMLVGIAWYVIIAPLLNAIMAAAGSGVTIPTPVTFNEFVTVFMTYCGLYMGGNTVIRSLKK